MVRDIDLDHDLAPAFTLLPNNGAQRWIADLPYYPALVLPVEKKDEFACPQNHIEVLEEFIKDCNNVLVVGHSALDDYMLSVLKAHLPETRIFALVDGAGTPDAKTQKAYEKLNGRWIRGVPQLGRATVFKDYLAGFTDFVRRRGLEEFGKYAS